MSSDPDHWGYRKVEDVVVKLVFVVDVVYVDVGVEGLVETFRPREKVEYQKDVSD